jgi:hypothetical protein
MRPIAVGFATRSRNISDKPTAVASLRPARLVARRTAPTIAIDACSEPVRDCRPRV